MWRNEKKLIGAARWLVLCLAAALTAAGLFALTGGILPFAVLKQMGDALSKDGTLELLTAARYAAARPWLLLGGMVLVAMGGSLFVFRRQAQRVVEAGAARLANFSKSAWQDGRALLDLLWQKRPNKAEWVALGLLVGAGIFARLVFIERAAQYDEVYSYLEFARHSFWQVVSDYHVPNNHVFNTLLMRVSILLFGGDLWAIRLPALLTGLLLIPATYGLARVVYPGTVGRAIGVAAAGGVALVPQLILFSTSGRGYMFVCLFTVLIFALGALVRKQKNRAAWLLLVMCATLGFYSIPIMLYPFGGLCLWLVIIGLFKDYDPAYGTRWGWLRYVIGTGMLAGVLTMLLYTPIFLHHGIFVFASGSSVAATVAWEKFVEGLAAVTHEVLDNWGFGLPGWIGFATVGGLLLALVFERRATKHTVSMPLALAGFIALELVVHRPFTVGRVWLFLLPLVIFWSLAGWIHFSIFFLPFGRKKMERAKTRALIGIVVVFLLSAFAWSINFLYPFLSDPDMVKSMWSEDVEQTTLFLKDHLREGDVVVVSFMIDARYWYYFDRYGIPQEMIRAIKSHAFRRVYVVVEPNCWWTVEGLLQDFGPDQVFLNMETLHPLGQVRNTNVYVLDANLSAVEKAYGKLPDDWGR